MKRLGFCVFVFIFGAGIYAQPALLMEAERYYQKGQYEEAANRYHQALLKEPRQLSILYNLGTVYYQQKEWGKALFFYEKALRVSPRDSDTHYNLMKTKEQRIDTFGELIGDNSIAWFSYLSLYEIGCVFLFLLTLTNGLLIYGVKRKGLDWLRGLTGISFVMLMIVGCVFGLRYYALNYYTTGVIIEKKVAVKLGPSKDLETLFYLHSGAVCKIQKKSLDWVKVRLPNGLSGWVLSDFIWNI